MRKTRVIFLLGVLLVGTFGLLGQTPNAPHVPNNPVPQWVTDNARKRAEIERVTNRDPKRNITIVAPKKPRVPVPDPDRAVEPATQEEIEEMAKERKERGAVFGVDRHYRKTFQLFLNMENTGIARLFPDKNCGMGTVVTLAELERCANVPEGRGGGSMFSFRCRADSLDRVPVANSRENWVSYAYLELCRAKLRTDIQSDIQFKGSKFIVGDDIVQGIMADIGDVDLAGLTLDHKAFGFLDDYDPKQSIPKIAKQNEVLTKGISGNGFTFTNAAPLKVNSTYVLRSVLYRYHEEGQLSVPIRGIDVRVAFRVVGQEPDGSIIIIWRELDRTYPRRKISDN